MIVTLSNRLKKKAYANPGLNRSSVKSAISLLETTDIEIIKAEFISDWDDINLRTALCFFIENLSQY